MIPDWLAAELPFEHHTERLRGLEMHWMTHGAGRPVLLVHGNPTWGFLWRKVATRLDGFRVVMPDLIGLGLSQKVGADWHTLDNHLEQLGALVDHLDLRDVIVVVQDWGGPVGTGAFLGREDRIGGLVVLNTVLGPPKPGFKATAFHRFSQMRPLADIAFKTLEFPQRALWSAQGDRSSIGRLETRAYRWPLQKNREAPLALARMVPDSMDHPSVAPLTRVAGLIEAYDGPAAIVWGDRDPVLGRLKKRICRALPQATLTETQAGHFLQEEVPDEIAAAIRAVHETGARDTG